MRLPHRIQIERATAGAEDAYGMPAQTWAVLHDDIPAFVQPLRIEELAQVSESGPVASDHRIFMYPTDIKASDRIRYDPDDGRVFMVDNVPDPAGLGHHLEVIAHLVETS